MCFRWRLPAAVSIVVIVTIAGLRTVDAATFTINFEDATVPSDPGPNTADISNTFGDAYGGSDTVHGVTFSDAFSVFRNTYTNAVGGNDLYGPTDGSLALTNTDGDGFADTGPGDQGLDGLTFTTHATLQGASFAANDYGNGSFGADQVTVTAFGAHGDLASVSESLVDGLGNPIRTLTFMNTASAFDPFTGRITGYRINRDVASDFVPFDAGGNYVADDFQFQSAAPEPSSAVALAIACGLLGAFAFRRLKAPAAN